VQGNTNAIAKGLQRDKGQKKSRLLQEKKEGKVTGVRSESSEEKKIGGHQARKRRKNLSEEGGVARGERRDGENISKRRCAAGKGARWRKGKKSGLAGKEGNFAHKIGGKRMTAGGRGSSRTKARGKKRSQLLRHQCSWGKKKETAGGGISQIKVQGEGGKKSVIEGEKNECTGGGKRADGGLARESAVSTMKNIRRGGADFGREGTMKESLAGNGKATLLKAWRSYDNGPSGVFLDRRGGGGDGESRKGRTSSAEEERGEQGEEIPRPKKGVPCKVQEVEGQILRKKRGGQLNKKEGHEKRMKNAKNSATRPRKKRDVV